MILKWLPWPVDFSGQVPLAQLKMTARNFFVLHCCDISDGSGTQGCRLWTHAILWKEMNELHRCFGAQPHPWCILGVPPFKPDPDRETRTSSPSSCCPLKVCVILETSESIHLQQPNFWTSLSRWIVGTWSLSSLLSHWCVFCQMSEISSNLQQRFKERSRKRTSESYRLRAPHCL